MKQYFFTQECIPVNYKLFFCEIVKFAFNGRCCCQVVQTMNSIIRKERGSAVELVHHLLADLSVNAVIKVFIQLWLTGQIEAAIK
jgi:hypothetical protein